MLQHVAVVDLNSLLQFVVLALAAAFSFLYLVRNTASRFFIVDSSFSSSDYSSSSDHRRPDMAAEVAGSCALCGQATTKQCARCKMVKYCSAACQTSHWSSEHKEKCKDLQSLYNANHVKSTSMLRERKASSVSSSRRSKIIKPSNTILFPYEEFIVLLSGDKPNYPPCGLLNCGNSCFANVVLQCLTFTRPLAVYLLEKGHRTECERNDWCFLCEFQTHVERASRTRNPFSPINILSRLANIGGNLGYGEQEDAHEFIRFAIDTMQSVCLDEFGGEKAVHPKYQETTLIQHIFGGRLQSQVICTECNNVSNQFENMMDLSVEIHGDAGSLEECLDQFTAKEWLHGDNMYRCDGCNAYVKAWKRLTLQCAPNILTIALKRFQSGRFGKLNKRVSFPETLDLSPYMSEIGDGNDIYKLYAVIVHVDMLNASFFGHYICYVKDFCGNWYRVDDCKVAPADLDEVLSEGAYMLLYKRISPRPSCLLPAEPMMKQENKTIKLDEIDPTPAQPAECLPAATCHDSPVNSGHLRSASSSTVEIKSEEELFTGTEDARDDIKAASSGANLPIVEDFELHDSKKLSTTPKLDANSVKDTNQSDVRNIESSSPISNVENGSGASTTVSNGSLLRMPAEESSTTEDCLLEKGNYTCDVSVSPLATSNGKVLDEVRPANSTSMLENGFGNGAANDSNGKSSRPKPKPLFAPGFLVKHPRKEFIKQDNKVAVGQNIKLMRLLDSIHILKMVGSGRMRERSHALCLRTELFLMGSDVVN